MRLATINNGLNTPLRNSGTGLCKASENIPKPNVVPSMAANYKAAAMGIR